MIYVADILRVWLQAVVVLETGTKRWQPPHQRRHLPTRTLSCPRTGLATGQAIMRTWRAPSGHCGISCCAMLSPFHVRSRHDDGNFVISIHFLVYVNIFIASLFYCLLKFAKMGSFFCCCFNYFFNYFLLCHFKILNSCFVSWFSQFSHIVVLREPQYIALMLVNTSVEV